MVQCLWYINHIKLIFGVLQGLVLGPLLFIMYTAPLSSVMSKGKVIKHHLYSDFFSIQKLTSLSPRLDAYKNKLKLNPEKLNSCS